MIFAVCFDCVTYAGSRTCEFAWAELESDILRQALITEVLTF